MHFEVNDEQEQIYGFYTALVRRNASLIKWLCMRQSDGDSALCDDLVQEVLLGLWLHIDSYRRSVPEKVWVGWQVRTILHDWRRHRLPPPAQLAFEVADSLAEEAIHTREQLEELTSYLTDSERDLVQRHLDGYKTKEIAEQLDLSSNAVYKRMKKVMEKLRIINEQINKR
ncbi:MAG: sigma-70 family RNA polymerase sigma factor [Bacteroidales bacterium]|nr:sigma-70 family RNA polymerase sigma factor [Bacteroidales bacterium]